ncbi:hypothetical protein scyTo_0017623 [Scyliorhinus torazame]|uniref:Histone H2A/H2B/H3 domain-containing protein n=1 Tax=Scyliorhinus torazame TaxID=75743 RepID=A0A401PWT9_SCYTO|nr:hypothetical protein [Scyliorhinus torazame]
MPELAAVPKGVESFKASKQLLSKVTKKLPKKRRKSRKQRYSTFVYLVLTQVHPSTWISSNAKSTMISFVVDILEYIASKALHLIYYKWHTISA